MPRYRLKYFDSRTRAEPARLLFFMHGVEFEDIIIESEEWLRIKYDMPLHQVPVLEVDDVIITQSKAITRYLGREFGYYGKTNLEGAQIDCIMDLCSDVITRAGDIYHYQGPGKFDKARFMVENKDVLNNFREVVVPDFLKKLQTLYHMNKAEDGFFVGDKLSIADLYYLATFDFVEIFINLKDMFAGFPKMAALYQRILTQEKVDEWRKKTSYGEDALKEK